MTVDLIDRDRRVLRWMFEHDCGVDAAAGALGLDAEQRARTARRLVACGLLSLEPAV